MLLKITLLVLLIANAIEALVERDFEVQEELISYSGVIKFKKVDDLRFLSENKIINLVKLAYEEMRTDFNTRRLPGNLPQVMVAFATNYGEIYFTSSMTGGRHIFLEEPTSMDDPVGRFDKIRALLKACRDGTHTTHNYFGKCGEPSAIDLYMSRHGGYLEDDLGPIKGRMFAWNGAAQTLVPPCVDDQAANGRYGCQTFITKWLSRVDVIRSGAPDNGDEDKVKGMYDEVRKTWRSYDCRKPEGPGGA
ncbi:MAG: hypothetical protein M1813_005334 [Trichoglossum hirsutum]|nr:MAG: hypothetical protein M1813_005334 [Trichoglossum hirsutum]